MRFVPMISLSTATLEEVQATVDAGYLDGDPSEWLVDIEGGWGGGGPTIEWLIQFLLVRGVNLAIDATIVATFTLGRTAARDTLANRRARRPAQHWAERRGLSSPHQLREWLDRVESWTWSDVANRLGIDADTAQSLLVALGYERDAGGRWRLGYSEDAAARRRGWIARELGGDEF